MRSRVMEAHTPRPCDRARYAYGALVSQIARMTTSEEFEDGAGGDAVETLDRLILEARELTGIDGPEAEDDEDDEDDGR